MVAASAFWAGEQNPAYRPPPAAGSAKPGAFLTAPGGFVTSAPRWGRVGLDGGQRRLGGAIGRRAVALHGGRDVPRALRAHGGRQGAGGHPGPLPRGALRAPG